MKISEAIYICKPNPDGTEPSIHWSSKFINNFWLWKTNCDCCSRWRLLISGMIIGGFPLLLIAIWIGWGFYMLTYSLVAAVFLVTAIFNKLSEKNNGTS